MVKIGDPYTTTPKHMTDIASLKKDYTIRKVIGIGKYGIICSGTMGKGDKKVEIAIKIIDLKKSSETYRTKFLPKELYHLEELRHKYIVKVYDIKVSENTFYVFMEKGFGGDLLDMLEQFSEGLPEHRAKQLYKMIASALKYIHGKGSAHRDIKSENILLMNKERTIAKLTDFGFSTTCFVPKTKQLMLRDTYCGTPTYSAPEIQRHKPYEAMRADIWSLGVVLYVMLLNKMPFTPTDIIHMAVNEPKTIELDFKGKHLSNECKDLIRKQLVVDPQKRITMAVVAQHPWLR